MHRTSDATCPVRSSRRPGAGRRAASCALRASLCCAALLIGCGGGSGAARRPPPTEPDDGGEVVGQGISFEGFSFRLAPGLLVDDPPHEDPGAWPPALGAPLDTVIVFHFSGPPQGALDGNTLPVFTTSDAVPDSVFAPALPLLIPALGDWVAVGDTVEFHPQVPHPPMLATVSAPAVQKPGLFPGSTYTARVSDAPFARVANLVGPGGETSFDTTSLPASYYPGDASAFLPPQVTAIDPPAGWLHPGVFSDTAPGASVASFPTAPHSVVLTYAAPLATGSEVLEGDDLDGDGVRDATWAFRSRATRLFVPLVVPAGALGVAHDVPALAGLEEGSAGAADGSDLVLHGDLPPSPLPAPAGLLGTPRALAVDRDPGLLWVLADAAGGGVTLSVVDHVLGDPSAARHSVDGDEQPEAWPIALSDPIGLLVTQAGRMLVFDRATRRVRELRTSLARRLSGLDAEPPDAPRLLDVRVADSDDGFVGDPFPDPTLEVLDLLQAPSGSLWALALREGDATPALHRLSEVDPDLDGVSSDGEGLPTGESGPQLPGDYVAAVFEDEATLLALDAGRDVIERVHLDSDTSELVASEVADRGWGGVASPARDLAFGVLDVPARIEVCTNADSGAVLVVTPAALLPVGVRVDLVQRQALASLHGVSLVNADVAQPLSPLGVTRLATYATPTPTAGAAARVDDVFLETFDDADAYDAGANDGLLAAAWGTLGGLRASVGALDGVALGDFVPAPPAGDPKTSLAYRRSNGPGEPDLDLAFGNLHTVLLDTDAQNFPLSDGSTPGVNAPITVLGGEFVFHDVIIPEGVRVLARGTRPLRITATGRIEVHGMIDVSGTHGFSDDTFDSGFLPVPGGPGGPGAGRGGDGHPTRFDPKGPGTIDQYVTPETGEAGMAPFPDASGTLVMQPRGGRGGLSTVGYDPGPGGYPRVPNLQPNDERHRPPGGGGGSFRQLGRAAEQGSGSYLVQSESSWFPFSHCPTDDKIHDALYGNDENRAAGKKPDTPLQCVYLLGDPEHPQRLVPGGAPGDAVFVDEEGGNDYIGPGGELSDLRGGQGGGGGGSRVVSMRHSVWAAGPKGQPEASGPPYFPKLFGGVFLSPTRFDSKGAGGGGGGGALRLRAFGDLVVGRTGILDASGGHGGGGEVVSNSNMAGGGGGGSGGAVLLQAGGTITLSADVEHRSAGYIDVDGDLGAAVDVSGGFGRDARTAHPGDDTKLEPFTYEVTRGDGGQGGFGLVQVQASGVHVDPGVFLFARQRAPLKLGPWTGDPVALRKDHPDLGAGSTLPVELRYVDMLHDRYAYPEGLPGAPGGPSASPRDRYLVLNGSRPPLVPRGAPVLEGSAVLPNEDPAGSGAEWADTRMLEHPEGSGRYVVEEPEPSKVMRTYNGYETVLDADGQVADLVEIDNPPDDPDFPSMPGTTWVGEHIPLALDLERPGGTPQPSSVDGQAFDPSDQVDRLPVVPLGLAPPPLGSVSVATSRWLAFPGALLRERDAAGLTPPFMHPFHGTRLEPVLDEGAVLTAGKVPGWPAHYVLHSGLPPFDPGLFGHGSPPDPPFNDLSLSAPEFLLPDVLADGAEVRVLFQGAHPVRAGALVPDPDTLTPWVADPSRLDGFGLVRMRVLFDVAAGPGLVVDPESPRPLVDDLRLRLRF
ncbi:MAG: hypothetical protein H6825_04480 [Planctomycetes bacterium]|nr:hypothetical protein [Planctomycetota bacterium]